MYNIGQIKNYILKYRLKQVLNTGEKSMFDKEIDRDKLEKFLNEDVNSISESAKVFDVNLKKTLENIDDNKLYEDIINLKNKYVG